MAYHSSLFSFLAFLGVFIFILLIFVVVLYVLSSYGLYKLALKQGIENCWLAWIPIANMYIVGRIIKTLKIDSYEIPRIELVLPIGWLVVYALKGIPLIGWLLSLAYFILILFALYKLYKIYKPEQAALWVVLSVILPFMGPIFIFMLRDCNPVEV